MISETNPKGAGRKPGSPNKISGELRTKLQTIANQVLEEFDLTFYAMEPKERMDFITKILPFCLSKVDNIASDEVKEPGNNLTFFADLKDQFSQRKASIDD